MSRHLPPHPNLDHLKKQAKDLLHDLQHRDPALKLADAQHVIARASARARVKWYPVAAARGSFGNVGRT